VEGGNLCRGLTAAVFLAALVASCLRGALPIRCKNENGDVSEKDDGRRCTSGRFASRLLRRSLGVKWWMIHRLKYVDSIPWFGP
jgi:hypothetical protein